MPISPLVTNNFIDSCAFDPKYAHEDNASVEIFKLYERGMLTVVIAHSTQKEIEHQNTPAWVKKEAQNFIYTRAAELTPEENNTIVSIEKVLAGNGKIENIRQDARHVFEAQKYGKYFITTDSRILMRARELRTVCDVFILKPSEFLMLVKRQSDVWIRI